MFVVFDLDGTLADVSHRVHFVRNGNRDWNSFFAACVNDVPVPHVVASCRAHLAAGHKVRVWSARSDKVRAETERWLADAGIDPCYLQHMRAEGDNTPDVALKRYWLSLEPTPPDLIYDDRQRVVDMWRAEGIPCFQVTANWEDSADERVIPFTGTGPLLRLMVGPSGAGKSSWVSQNVRVAHEISTDAIRSSFFRGDHTRQDRNDDVFLALHRIARARLSSGLPVTIDATNLRRRDRLSLISLAPAGAPIEYVVIDRPLDEKLRDRGWRPEELVRKHHERMQSCLKDILAGDGLPGVTVRDLRNVLAEAA